ncbi:MAG: S8 family peptidase [Coriobacteriia bacterium]
MLGNRARAVLAAVIAVATVTAMYAGSASAADAPARMIVVFERGAPASARAQVAALGAARVKNLPLVNGAVVMLPANVSLSAIARIDGVKYVEPDARAYVSVKPTKPALPQVLPWGIDRVNADESKILNTGEAIRVAIVDTGIDATHPDLAANVKGGMSAVAYTAKYTDDNGHGSHVAGIVAALDNTIGVVGVGPDIDLYSVKVLNRKGSGYVSDIIEGLGWCQANGMDVVNMSLGTSSDVQSFHDAVSALYASGTVIVAAAGNDGIGSAVNYPAAYLEVIAVSATTQADGLASFTCTGPQVELAAPGYSIYSTYKSGGYATLSGTSMASPHVAGVAALVIASPVRVGDTNGAWDPVEVRTRLQATVEDLGAAGWDPGYGYGLVRADLAIAQ